MKTKLLTQLVLILVLSLVTWAAQAQNANLTIEQRLQRVEDELAIHRVLVEYSATQDARDFEGYVALFATNGEWINGNSVYKGRDAIHQMLVNLYGETPADFVNNESYHITSNPQIDIHGDKAAVKSRHLLIMRGTNGEPTPMLGGRYEDEFIREEGEWKILRRVDYPVMPTREEWLKTIQAWRAAQ